MYHRAQQILLLKGHASAQKHLEFFQRCILAANRHCFDPAGRWGWQLVSSSFQKILHETLSESNSHHAFSVPVGSNCKMEFSSRSTYFCGREQISHGQDLGQLRLACCHESVAIV